MPKFKMDQLVILEVFDADFNDCNSMLCKVIELTGNSVYRVCTVKAKIDESVIEGELEPVEDYKTKLAVTKMKGALEHMTSSKKNTTAANAKIATPRSESRAITTLDAKLTSRSNPLAKESSGNGIAAHTTVSTATNAKPIKAPTKSTESDAKKRKMSLSSFLDPSTKDLTSNT
ncbi:hypothetical protein BJ508DRAFT_315349 [Ascobolus immersus RN42]|uniref:Uncharacterized protein n=1 Tax=Ascobolus immersus RN42 TaxID=1160509 RepID=A0A3N4HB97_ASCIM|nr:hypothetical protein BJ508DRAFT_315349 [Ascobolus immersus RN42]